jgi:hypothetical protein
MNIIKTFTEIRKKYKIEKWFHMPWHFSASGHYVCFLQDDQECYKCDGGYIVRARR